MCLHIMAIRGLGVNLKNSEMLLTFVGGTQMKLIYLCFVIENDFIIRTMDHIQEIVDRSK